MYPLRVICLLGVTATTLMLGAGAAAAAPLAATADYLLTLGGINVATAKVALKDAADHYSIDLSAQVAGLGSLVASGTAKVDAAGTSTGDTLRSEDFELLTHANDSDFSVSVQFAAGNVSAFVVRPPLLNNIDRVPIERSQLYGVNDMLSAFILKGGQLDRSLCARDLHIFTGVERFDLDMHYLADDRATSLRTGYQGPVVQCQLKYIPISGHFTNSDMTNYLAKSDRIFLWYAPLGATGYFIPYRVLVTTSVGDLSMVLTSLKD